MVLNQPRETRAALATSRIEVAATPRAAKSRSAAFRMRAAAVRSESRAATAASAIRPSCIQYDRMVGNDAMSGSGARPLDAASGIAFVILMSAALFLPGPPPRPTTRSLRSPRSWSSSGGRSSSVATSPASRCSATSGSSAASGGTSRLRRVTRRASRSPPAAEACSPSRSRCSAWRCSAASPSKRPRSATRRWSGPSRMREYSDRNREVRSGGLPPRDLPLRRGERSTPAMARGRRRRRRGPADRERGGAVHRSRPVSVRRPLDLGGGIPRFSGSPR